MTQGFQIQYFVEITLIEWFWFQGHFGGIKYGLVRWKSLTSMELKAESIESRF